MKNHTALFPALTLILAIIALHGLEAQQTPIGPNLVSVPSTLSGEYDALEGTVIPAEVLVSGRQVSFGIGFSAGGSGSYTDRRLSGPNGVTLAYQLKNLVDGGFVLKDLDGAADGSGLLMDSIAGGGPSGRTVEAEFNLISPRDQILPAGTFTDVVTATLYDTTSGSFVVRGQEPVLISLTVPAYLSVAVVDTGSFFDPDARTAHLDFGSLSQGISREVDLLVRTNTEYAVSIASMNNEVMAMVSPSDGSVVPYSLRVNGVPRDLSGGGTEVALGSGPTTINGDRHTLHFEIGEIGQATSGAYEDHLTVIVTAR